MKRPINMTVEIDDKKPFGYALMAPNSADVDIELFVLFKDIPSRIDTLSEDTHQSPLEKFVRTKIYKSKFYKRYACTFDRWDQLHQVGMNEILRQFSDYTVQAVYTFTV
jgi:hypothetical protein